jgi:hypothetical protein
MVQNMLKQGLQGSKCFMQNQTLSPMLQNWQPDFAYSLGKNKEPIMMDYYSFSAVVPIPYHQIIKITDSTQWTTSKYFALIELPKCFVQ